MGFDVTFHPISKDQLQHFFFDVLDDPSKADARAKELAADAKRRKVISKLYKALPKCLEDDDATVGTDFAVGAAIIAGFLHPYWYARGDAITFLAEKHEPKLVKLFVPLGKVTKSKISRLKDTTRGLIWGNESASGFIPPKNIAKVDAILDDLANQPGRGGLSKLETVVGDESLESIRAVLTYCRQNNLGMIEAADIVVPIANQCVTDFNNMRAHFLGKMEP
jgi:hypothetical protein